MLLFYLAVKLVMPIENTTILIKPLILFCHLFFRFFSVQASTQRHVALSSLASAFLGDSFGMLLLAV